MFECIPLKSSRLTSEEWDEFINNSDNGTIFHKRKFFSYHPAGRFSDNSLVITKSNKIIALFPAALIQGKKKRFWFHIPVHHMVVLFTKKTLIFMKLFKL